MYTRVSVATQAKIKAKYCGLAIHDMTSYLECRLHVVSDHYPEHFTTLKSHYRRMFLSAPFRKGFK